MRGRDAGRDAPTGGSPRPSENPGNHTIAGDCATRSRGPPRSVQAVRSVETSGPESGRILDSTSSANGWRNPAVASRARSRTPRSRGFPRRSSRSALRPRRRWAPGAVGESDLRIVAAIASARASPRGVRQARHASEAHRTDDRPGVGQEPGFDAGMGNAHGGRGNPAASRRDPPATSPGASPGPPPSVSTTKTIPADRLFFAWSLANLIFCSKVLPGNRKELLTLDQECRRVAAELAEQDWHNAPVGRLGHVAGRSDVRFRPRRRPR